jgi:hypothetical protein
MKQTREEFDFYPHILQTGKSIYYMSLSQTQLIEVEGY